MHKLMHSHVLCCRIFFCTLCLFNAAALSFLTSTDANLNFIEPTVTDISNILPNLPNDDFRYYAEYHGVDLPDIACMMVCVHAMRELALLEFTEECPPKTFVVEEYPQITLYVGNPRNVLTPRWAMFLITLVLREMITRNVFQTSQFYATYSGFGGRPRVAVVRFIEPNMVETKAMASRTEPAVPQIPGAASTANLSMDTISSNIRVKKSDTISYNDQMWADVTYRGNDIPRNDMFIAIIWTLLNLAPHEKEERVRVASNTYAAFTASVTTTFLRVVGTPAGLRLQYGNLISLVAKLPEVLLRDNTFSEMDIVAKEDNVVVGKGTVRSAALSGIMNPPFTTNVSAS